VPEPGRIHRSATSVMSIVMIVIGCALIVRTIVAGGAFDASGILLGALFILAGAIRLYVQTRGRLK
jgi:hypothetical protein